MKRNLAIIIFLFSFLLTSCSNYYFYKAEKSFKKQNYEESIFYIKKINNNNLNSNILLLEGDSFFQLGQKEKAYSSYYLANIFDKTLIIKNLIPYFYQEKEFIKALEIINKMNETDKDIEIRSIEYICLKKLNKKEEANLIFNKFLTNLNEKDKLILQILSSNNNIENVNNIYNMYKQKKYKETMELIEICDSNNLIDNSFLSLLNTIFNDSNFSIEFRAKCCLILSSLFKNMNNIKQSSMYEEYASKLLKIK